MVMRPGATISRAFEVGVPAKAILAGEHFVLYGANAVASPVPSKNLILRVALRPGAELVLPEPFHDLSKAIGAVLEGRLRAFVRLSSTSDIPQGAGLGSSAAFAVAFARSLVLASLNDELQGCAGVHWGKLGDEDERSAMEIAAIIEGKIHGRASGIDTAAVSGDGPILFRRGVHPVEPIAVAEGLRFLLVDTGLRRSTREQIDRVALARSNNGDLFQGLAESAAATVDRFVAALSMGERREIHSCIQILGTHLRDLGLEPDSASGLRTGLEAMGISLKVTGAGGGGFLLGFAEDDRVLEQALESLEGSASAFCFSLPSMGLASKPVQGTPYA